MRRFLAAVALLAASVAALAWDSDVIVNGPHTVALATDPPTTMQFFADAGPPNATVTDGATNDCYVWNEESMCYRCTTGAVTRDISFSRSTDDCSFAVWPPLPQLGPPNSTAGKYEYTK